MNSLNGVFDEIGLRKTSAKIAGILAIIASLFFMYTALMGSFPAMTQRGVLLALTLPMIFLLIGSGIDSKFGRILDIVSVIIAAVPFISVSYTHLRAHETR